MMVDALNSLHVYRECSTTDQQARLSLYDGIQVRLGTSFTIYIDQNGCPKCQTNGAVICEGCSYPTLTKPTSLSDRLHRVWCFRQAKLAARIRSRLLRTPRSARSKSARTYKGGGFRTSHGPTTSSPTHSEKKGDAKSMSISPSRPLQTGPKLDSPTSACPSLLMAATDVLDLEAVSEAGVGVSPAVASGRPRNRFAAMAEDEVAELISSWKINESPL